MNKPDYLQLGPLAFQPGVSRVNLAAMLLGAFGTMAIVSFMSFVQPYVLTEIMNIPQDEQGALTGNLHAFQEIIFICFAGFAGAISDKIGRPTVYAAGLVIVGLGYALYPMADSVQQLVIIRALFAIGVAMVAVMLSACIVDYIQEPSRGRWIGTTSIFNGLGIVTMSFALARLPELYKSRGMDEVAAGRFAFLTVTALCVVVAIILFVGLYRAERVKREEGGLLEHFMHGLRAGRDNPKLAVAYGGAFIGRGDFAVVGTFFSLWLVQTGIENGMEASTALAKAGMLFGMIQLCALIWAPFMGMIVDRVDRLLALAIGVALAGGGYLFMSQVPDPFGPVMYPAGLLLGMGETGVIVSAGALLGQEARADIRGPIVGVFGLCGGIGILATSFFGGQLFDGLSRTAPFAMMGLLNLCLMVVALLVYQAGHRAPAKAPVTETTS